MFRPTHDQPQWSFVYDLLAEMEPGQVATYEDLSAAIGRDIRSNRAPVYAAQKRLEDRAKRTLICVSGKGYRVAFAEEHERLATQHQGRARRQVRKARRRASSANRQELSQQQRERLDVMESTLHRHESMLRRNAARIEEVDQARREVHRQTKADVAALSARLVELESRLEPSPKSPDGAA